MFIVLQVRSCSAPFEGAEFNLVGTQVVSFRPFERRRQRLIDFQCINISLLRSEDSSNSAPEVFGLPAVDRI